MPSIPVTFRVDKGFHDWLTDLGTDSGLSRAELLRRGFSGKFQSILAEVRRTTYQNARSEYEGIIRVTCPICRDPKRPMRFDVYKNAEHGKAMFEGFKGWAHPECHKKQGTTS
jgi:hypothetical protein